MADPVFRALGAFIDDPQPPVDLPMLSVRRPPEVPEGTQLPGQRELLELCERHGWDRKRRRDHAAASIEAVLHWGARLGVLEVVD